MGERGRSVGSDRVVPEMIRSRSTTKTKIGGADEADHVSTAPKRKPSMPTWSRTRIVAATIIT
jgi:hypothetical protein